MVLAVASVKFTMMHMKEVSKNVNHVVERSTEIEESLTAVGDCGPTEQEIDICKHPDEFPESGRLDKDSNSASKEVGKAVSYADIFLQTVSRNFTVDKDDKMHPETSVQAGYGCSF
ncbi:hypothetical protein POM88_047392 [Heracleum sosnowskyi]|uniref:Uncharacterized protein n=1 Tax=Heracleum sosnowskyi TaxID=360622 RepID=A0AAD8LYN9_9APIA|nr:hypothetical protein POM88_047392 [Heracleum sosnowskyi]